MRKKLSVIGLVCLLLISAGCEKDTSNTASDEIHITLRGELKSTDPMLCNDETCGVTLSILNQRLFKYDQHGVLRPDLVQKSKVLNGKIRIQLKNNRYFSGGHKLGSEDVQFCIHRIIDEKRHTWIVKNIAGIEPLDEREFHILLKRDDTIDRSLNKETTQKIWQDLKIRLTMPQTGVFSKKIYQKKREFAGTNPFYLQSFSDKKIILRRKNLSNAGKIKEFIIHTLPDDSARWFFFQRDYFDVYEADGVFRHLPYNREKYKIVDIPELMVLYAAIVAPADPKKESILKDVAFRRALNYRLDRNSLTKKVLLDSYKPADYPVPDELGGSVEIKYIYQPNYPIEINDPSEKITILSAPDRERQNAARAIRGVLKKMGMNSVEVKVYDLPALIRMNNERRPGIYLFKWIADYPHPSNFIAPLFYSKNAGQGGNRSYFKNDGVDAAILKREYTKKNIKTLQKMIRDEAPWVFIGFSRQRYFVARSKKIHPPFVYTAWLDVIFASEN